MNPSPGLDVEQDMSLRTGVGTGRTSVGPRTRMAVSGGLELVTAAALLSSGYVHWHLRRDYNVSRTSVLSQGTVFVVQAVACLAVALVLVGALAASHSRGRKARAVALALVAALLVAAGSLTAVLVYRYVDVGRIGVVPNMYEPAWYRLKSASAVADAVATLSSLGALILHRRGQVTRRRCTVTRRRMSRSG